MTGARQRTRLIGAAVVVVIAAIAACALDVRLSSTEQNTVVITPANNGEFGSVSVGSIATLNVTITPATGAQNDSIIAISAPCTDYAVMYTGLTAIVQGCDTGSGSGSGCVPTSYMFGVIFEPTGIGGSESCTVHVNVSGNDQKFTVHGTGVADMYTMDVTPLPDAPLYDVKVGLSNTTTITVHNTGTQSIAIGNIGLTQTIGSDIAVAGPTTAHMLASNARDMYDVTCTPTTTGPLAATLMIPSNSTNQTNPANVYVTCNGTNSNLTVSPARFPTVRLGEPPVTLDFTVTNTGTLPADITSYTLIGASSDLTKLTPDPGTPITLGHNESTTVTLAYAPTAVHPLGPLATLVVNYDASSTFSAGVSGETVVASMVVSNSALDFGPLCIGEQASKHVSLFANNLGGFKVSAISDPAVPFARMTPAIPFDVQGFDQNELAFDVTATASSQGIFDDKLAITTDLPTNPMFEIPLHAQGLVSDIAATPDKLDFGLDYVGVLSGAQAVELTNCRTGAPIVVQSATIDGPEAADFAIIAGDIPKSLATKDSDEFLIVFNPRNNGVRRAVLTLTYDGGVRTVVLLGQGDHAVDRGTYYACSTGRPATAWPIGLALFALRRRRRRARAIS